MATGGAGRIVPKDLEDPTLFRLNSVVDLIQNQIARTQAVSQPFSFGNHITAPKISIPQTKPPPAGSDEVLTRRSADLLYSPTTIKQALQDKTWQTVPSLPFSGGPTTGSSGNSAIGGVVIEEQTLVANTAITSSSTGGILVKALQQDGTGGHTITWDAAVFIGADTGILTTANSYAVFLFAWLTGASKYVQISQNSGII